MLSLKLFLLKRQNPIWMSLSPFNETAKGVSDKVSSPALGNSLRNKQPKSQQLATANIYFPSLVCTCEWTRTAVPFPVSFYSSTSDKGTALSGRCSFLGQRRRTRGSHIGSFCLNIAYVLLAHSPLVPKKVTWSSPTSIKQENTLCPGQGKKYLKTIIQSITDLS